MPGTGIHDSEEPPARYRPDGTEQILSALPGASRSPGDTVTHMARTPRRREATAPAAASDQAGEAARRVRDNLPRPAAAPVASGMARPEPRKSRNPFGFLKRFEPRFVADVIGELRKVTWPTFAETRYLTIVVAIVAIVMGIFLGALDLGFGWIIEKVFFS